MLLDPNRLWTAAILLLAAVGLYGGCRAVLDVLMPPAAGARGRGEGRAFGTSGRRALGQAVPIAAAALAAMAAHQPALAMVIIFSSSVALLTLVLGLATLVAHGPPLDTVSTSVTRPSPMMPQAPASAGRNRRIWMLLLPAALVAFIAGLRAEFGWLAGASLLVLGLCIWVAWRESIRLGHRAANISADLLPARTQAVHALRTVQTFLALGVCAAGAWMMLQAATAAAAQSQQIRPGTIAAVVICPLLVLPVLGSAATAAQHGVEIVTPLIGTVLLNICLLLPICIVVSYAMTKSPVPFPPGVWRLENMLLVALGLFLLIAALRWWSLRRAEGMALVAGYFLYLMLLMAR